MTNSPTKGMKVLFVIASEGYQQVEYNVPKKILQGTGIIVVTASDKPGGAVAKDKSTTIVDIPLDKVNIKDYAGIFLIGGPGALEHLDIPVTHKLVYEAKNLGIPYGAICISVRILAKAGVLQGKKATGWDADKALRGILEGFGATYEEGKGMVTDGLVVTAVGPAVAEQFAQGIRRVLTKEKLD